MSPSNVTFKCGSCGNLLSIGAELHGQMVRCPYCQQVIQIPRMEATALSAPAAATPGSSEPPGSAAAQDGPHWGDLLGSSGSAAMSPEGAALVETASDPAAHEPESSPAAPVLFEPAAPWDKLNIGAQTMQFSPGSSDGEGTLSFVPSPGALPAPADGAAPATALHDESPWAATTLTGATAPTAEVGERTPAPPRPRRKLPVSIWLLSILIPYSLMATVAAVFFIQRAQEQQIHPLETLQDQGLYETIAFDGRRRDAIPNIGAIKDKAKDEIQLPTDKLAPWMPRVKLGETTRFGGIDVTPLDITRRTLEFLVLPADRESAKDQEALVLRLKIKNVSGMIFHPDDSTFNRALREPEVNPYTFLEIGEGRYYGFVRDPLTERVKGQNFDELLHDAELETSIIAFQGARGEKAVAALARVPPDAELIWRVHLRKGREEVRLKSGGRIRTVWTTTIVPVQFTPAEVKTGSAP